MSKRIRYWCDSGANAFSCREGSIDFDELGMTEAEWVALSDEEKDERMRDVALDRLDWGYEVEGDAEK